MKPSVLDLIRRRGDLSTFIIHLTRNSDDGNILAKNNLIQILRDGCIESRSPLGPLHDYGNDALKETQKAVSFTETPLEFINTHFCEVDDEESIRKIQFEPYGIVLSKFQARRRGLQPVWYINKTIGFDWLDNDDPVTDDDPPLKRLRLDAIHQFENNGVITPYLEIAPYFDVFGT